MKRVLIVGMLTLIASGCSSVLPVKSIELSTAPQACLEVCGPLPEQAEGVEDFVYKTMQVYGECAIKHKQCAAALTARILK